MNTVTTIPVTVTPEAAARIAELGFTAEVERMIEHARQTLPEIRCIEVVLNERYEDGDEDGVAIDVWSDRPFNPDEHISWELSGRIVRLFPPEVLEHLGMSYCPRL